MNTSDLQQTDTLKIYRAKVNLETSRIAWQALQRFFASGAAVWAVVVSPWVLVQAVS